MRPIDRVLLLISVVLAGYLVVIGIDQFGPLPIVAYTIAFGTLIIAGLLLIILGYEVLESPLVVVASTAVPLSLSLGLVWQHLHAARIPYMAFVVAGFLGVAATRLLPLRGKPAVIVLACVHGVAGVVITALPLVLAVQGEMKPPFALVGVGGALIGVGGLLLAFLRAGRPILSREAVYKIFPWVLLMMTACFSAGIRLG